MGKIYKPGTKLTSTVCKTQIMVLRVPNEELDIWCGGMPMMVGEPGELGRISPDHLGGTLVGKRYTNKSETMEFLCTRGGDGRVAVNGTLLDIKQARQLPSSD